MFCDVVVVVADPLPNPFRRIEPNGINSWQHAHAAYTHWASYYKYSIVLLCICNLSLLAAGRAPSTSSPNRGCKSTRNGMNRWSEGAIFPQARGVVPEGVWLLADAINLNAIKCIPTWSVGYSTYLSLNFLWGPGYRVSTWKQCLVNISKVSSLAGG